MVLKNRCASTTGLTGGGAGGAGAAAGDAAAGVLAGQCGMLALSHGPSWVPEGLMAAGSWEVAGRAMYMKHACPDGVVPKYGAAKYVVWTGAGVRDVNPPTPAGALEGSARE